MASLTNTVSAMAYQCNQLKRIAIACTTLFFSVSVGALQPIADIAQTPLELTPTVEPNVMILLDDSGSMDFEVMTADALSSGLFFASDPDGSNYGATTPELTIKQRVGCELVTAALGGYAYGIASPLNQYTPSSNFGSDKVKCYVADEQAWRFRCASFNTLYYDPNQTYQPWVGLRSDGTPFPPAPIKAAPLDPYQANSDTIDIESPDPSVTGINNFRYYTCSRGDDLNANFTQDSEVVIDAATPEASKQNFANWFSYHRSRHLRAKALLGNFIANQNKVRIGLTKLNPIASSRQVMEMNESFEDQGVKRNLLDTLYSSTPSHTSSRYDTRYIQAARYLGCRTNSIFFNVGGCPAEAAPAGSCQANHIVLASDGFLDNVSAIGDNSINDADADSSNVFDGGAFIDAPAEVLDISLRTFSDVAIRFYKRDLHNQLPNDVEPTEADRNRYPFDESNELEDDETIHQHIKAHVVLFDVPLRAVESELLRFPENELVASGAPFPFWLNPAESDLGLLQSLYHAAYSGRGEYVSATQSLSGSGNAVQTLIDQVSQGVGSTTPIAINTQGAAGDVVIFRTFFDSTSNAGDVTAQEIVINSDGRLNIESNGAASFLWSAASELDTLVNINGTRHEERNILTYSGAESEGVYFEFDELDAAQQNQLRQPIPGTSDIGEHRLEYLRGLSEREGTSLDAGQFRMRRETTSTGGGITHYAKLGTIANAAPVFVGQPQAAGRFGGAWPNANGKTYFDFQTSDNITSRDPSLLIAANDGMLHVFDTANGVERFAYVPSLIVENLSALTFPEYRHRFYVDSTPVVEDAYIRIDGSSSQSWNTIVIGGLGAGGRGYYALNITDSDLLDDPADQVLWEFGPADDPDAFVDTAGELRSDLGLSFAQPVIAMSNATDSNEQRWVAVFGNGYNNTGVDGSGVIYVLFIDRGIDGDWSQSGDLVKINLDENGITNPNGVGDVRAIDRDGNGTIDHLYAGDLLGNLHAVDISSSNPNDWNLSSNQYVLYEARYSATNQSQPITTRPIVVNNEGGTTDDVIVVFATGSYITRSDAIDTDIQSLYGVIDDFSGNQVNANNLVEQTLTNVQFVDEDSSEKIDVRILSENPASNSSEGWFIDFDVTASTGSSIEFAGEKAVRALQVRSGILFMNTVIPQALNCDPAAGGFSLALNPQTGTAGEEVIFDINNDSIFDSKDNIDVATEAKVVAGIRFKSTPTDSVFYGDYRITQLSDSDIDAVLTNTAEIRLTGRQAWREIEF